ncbi:MAG: sugar phosphate isomerase/epimerase family protein [Pirellula sp.]
MKSAVTISLVEEARGGPFVFWGNILQALEQAQELGFDAVEIFPPDAETLRHLRLAKALREAGLSVAAVGTGAGWVKHRLHLADEDTAIRERAVTFVRSIIDCAAELGAPAIIGSMQGRSSPAVKREQAASLLKDGLATLSEHAQKSGIILLYEPLNRYETDQANTLEQGLAMIEGLDNVRLLADWFHMNIEEADMAGAIRKAGNAIGHIHFADSNRMAIGYGHLEVEPLIAALNDIGYNGYLSAEVFSKPDAHQAAKTTIDAFRNYIRPSHSLLRS